MNRFFAITASAVLMSASISAAYAAPSSGDQLAAKKAKAVRATLALMDQQIANISDTAFTMNQAIFRGENDFEFQSDELNDLKDQVNEVGRELAVIDAERDSIPQWQAAAVDQILPIMHDIAVEATQATNTFNVDSLRLTASDYGVDTNEVSHNALNAAHLLHADLKLAHAKAKEGPMTVSLGEQNSAGTK
jgi:hypothetical protein